jgi:hypothetical protein
VEGELFHDDRLHSLCVLLLARELLLVEHFGNRSADIASVRDTEVLRWAIFENSRDAQFSNSESWKNYIACQ